MSVAIPCRSPEELINKNLNHTNKDREYSQADNKSVVLTGDHLSNARSVLSETTIQCFSPSPPGYLLPRHALR